MKKILFALPIVLLLAAGCNSNSQPTNQQTQNTSNANTQNDTANWQNYTSQKFGFEVKSPTDWYLSAITLNSQEQGARMLSDKSQKSPYVDITIGQVSSGSNTCNEPSYQYEPYVLPNGIAGKRMLDNSTVQKNQYICIQHNNQWYQIAVNVVDMNGSAAQAETSYSGTINKILSTFKFTK